MSNNIFEVLKNKKIKAQEIKPALDVDDLFKDNNTLNKIEKTINKNNDNNQKTKNQDELSLLIQEIIEQSENTIKNALKMFGIEIITKEGKNYINENNTLKELNEFEIKKLYFEKIYSNTYPSKNLDEAIKVFEEKYSFLKEEYNKKKFLNEIKEFKRGDFFIKNNKNNIKYPIKVRKYNSTLSLKNDKKLEEENLSVKIIFDNLLKESSIVYNPTPLEKIIPFLEKKEEMLNKKEKLEKELNKIKDNKNKIKEENEIQQIEKKENEIKKDYKKINETISKINDIAPTLYQENIKNKIFRDDDFDKEIREITKKLLKASSYSNFKENLQLINKTKEKCINDLHKKDDKEKYENISIKTLLMLCDEVIESLEITLKKAENLNKEIENKILKFSSKNEEKIIKNIEKNDTITENLKIEKRRKI